MALSDYSRHCKFGGRPALALSEPDWFGSIARRLRDRTREYDLLFPANDVFAVELAAELGLLGPESLNKLPPARPDAWRARPKLHYTCAGCRGLPNQLRVRSVLPFCLAPAEPGMIACSSASRRPPAGDASKPHPAFADKTATAESWSCCAARLRRMEW